MQGMSITTSLPTSCQRVYATFGSVGHLPSTLKKPQIQPCHIKKAKIQNSEINKGNNKRKISQAKSVREGKKQTYTPSIVVEGSSFNIWS